MTVQGKSEAVSGEVIESWDLVQAVPLAPVPQMTRALSEYSVRRKAFRDWLKEQMTQGVHFGVPPGCEPQTNRNGDPVDSRGNIILPTSWQFKPSLYKAGAQLLCDLLLLKAEFSIDQETWQQVGEKAGTVCIKCILVHRGGTLFPFATPGEAVGEGRGAATVKEPRKPANVAIKMAQKCAMVDAVLNTLGISDLYTQDIEDMPPRSSAPGADEDAPEVKPRDEREGTSLTDLFQLYQSKSGGKNRDDFKRWASTLMGTEDNLGQKANWTDERIAFCKEELDKVK